MRQLFMEEDANFILQMHVPSTNRPDILRWAADNKGIFFLQSAYALIQPFQCDSLDPILPLEWKLLW